jgi:hypothetical protein
MDCEYPWWMELAENHVKYWAFNIRCIEVWGSATAALVAYGNWMCH